MSAYERFNKVRKIVSHLGCHDGIASTMMAHKGLTLAHSEPEVLWLSPGSDALKNLEVEPGMLFVDLSPPEARFKEFLEGGTMVFDHHPTAEKVVRAFEEAGQGKFENGPEHCGATLAFEHIYKPMCEENQYPNTHLTAAKAFADLAAIRDNFVTDHEDWSKAMVQSEVLTFFPWKHWDYHAPYLTEDEKYLGKVLLERNQGRIEWIAKNAMHTEFDGLHVAVFQANGRMTSDTFEHLRKTEGVQIGFGFNFIKHEDGHMMLVFAVRSTDDFDAGSFCKKWGGGGHYKAAGFNIKMNYNESPYKTVTRLLNHDW